MIRTGIATMPAASGERRLAAFGTGLLRSHPIPAVRPEFPVPVLGLMENPAPERALFPARHARQMETTL